MALDSGRFHCLGSPIGGDGASAFLAYELADTGKDLDPALNLALRKVTMLRRVVAKGDVRKTDIQKMLEVYQRPRGCVPCEEPVGCVDELAVKACGPLGLLIEDLARYGCKLSNDLVVTGSVAKPIDIINIPFNQLMVYLLTLVK